MSTSVHSNAFNFRSYMDHGVDPRTGQYTVSLAVPALKSHTLAGPPLQLSIAFNPLNTRDAGFGLGWGINLTEFAPENGLLSLGTGETFKVTGTGDTPNIPERKLPTFHFHKQSSDIYRVVHKSGMVEVLKVFGGSTPLALPTEILGSDGRGVQLSYVTFQGRERLSTVSDGNSELLRVGRNEATNIVELQFYPGQGPDGQPLATFMLHLNSGGRVEKIVLPTQEKACWRLAYKTVGETTALSEVWTPTGAHETIEYLDGGHRFPGNAHTPIPRVTRHVVDPGAGQPPIEVHYEYGNTNFLGYGELSSWSDDGFDNLYRIADSGFTYDSTAILWAEGRAQRKVERVYNRFHLMTRETTTQATCRKTVVNTYYADLPENRFKSFDEQPAQCQLPWSVETSWELTDDSTKRRTELSRTEYDEHGNLTVEINADGTREDFSYYPAEGEPGVCPPDPEGFLRNLRTRTVHPAPAEHGTAPVLRTEIEYITLPPIPGSYSRPFIAEQLQTLSELDGPVLKRLHTEYFSDPTDALLLGRTRSVSETLNDLPTFTDYEYQTGPNADLAADVLQITEHTTGFDGAKQVVVQQQSTLSGQTVMMLGLDGVEVRYAYDPLNRVVNETVSPGTDYEASRTYVYHLLNENDAGPAWQLMTDAQNVQTRTRFDGLSRAVHEERQDVDAALAAGLARAAAAFRPTYTAHYDALGQRSQETVVDWIGDEVRALTTGYEYDDWGERKRTVRPDGVSEVTEISPFGPHGPVERRWLESAATPPAICDRRVSHFNRFGKTFIVQHLGDDERPVLTIQQVYDGLGQCVASHELSDMPERVTRYTYDAWRRVVATILPDGTTLHYAFAAHSTEALPVSIRVDPVNAALPEMIAGEQTFDGLDRVIERIVGGRTETFEYTGGSLSPNKRTLPSGTMIDIDYVGPLGDAPRSITVQGKADSYVYDAHSGMLTGAENLRGKRQYEYALTGKLAVERWTTSNGGEHLSTHRLSREGRPLERKDSGPGSAYSVTTTHQYDANGRIKCTTQGAVQVEMTYDVFGRPWETTTQNMLTGQILVTTQTYDTFNRETGRSLNVGGRHFTVTQTWRADSQLATRHLETDGHSLLHEEFHYDRRNRLQRHVCTGEQRPQDRFGNAIAQQVFTYDAMDNVTRCLTMFGDGSRDIAEYHYATGDACQLVEITHEQHPDYPASETLDYDDDGNLLNDAQGRELRYDALGRLLGIVAAGQKTTYHYDGHGELAGTVEADGAETLRFYQGYQLNHEVQGGKVTHLLYANDSPVAQIPDDNIEQSRLLLTTAIGSVIAEARQNTVTTAAYTAYGESGAGLAALLGFNGEMREVNDWYLLGRGYRAYCPALMRFNRPDSESPFGMGGLNPYIYCEGNPVTFRDRSGHRRELPEYIYPPPPVEQPKPAEGGGGGGWMKWIGVAISAVFLVASVVAMPFTAGLSSPVFLASLKGVALQVASIGMQVGANLVSDPNLQMALMLGGMGLGIYGGMVSSKASAAASTLAKQAKAAGAGAAAKFNAGGNFNIPRAQLGGSPGGQSLGSKAIRPVELPSGTMPSQPWTAVGARAPAPQNYVPRVRLPTKANPLRLRRNADFFTTLPMDTAFRWRSASPQSPGLAAFAQYV